MRETMGLIPATQTIGTRSADTSYMQQRYSCTIPFFLLLSSFTLFIRPSSLIIIYLFVYLKGAFSIMNYHNGRASIALTEIFPDIGLDQSKIPF